MLGYIMAQVNSKKRLKPTDIIKFAWEKEQESGNKRTKTKKKRNYLINGKQCIKRRTSIKFWTV